MTNTTTIRGIEQGRAKFAYECVSKASQKEATYCKEYKAYVKKVPMMIKTNGLGATLAFILSKAKEDAKTKERNPYRLIYDQTAEWLQTDQKKLIELADKKQLIREIITLDSARYRVVTFEVLALFIWLRRFADGLIEGEDEL
jgi:CRISPR-associated protein Cmr5